MKKQLRYLALALALLIVPASLSAFSFVESVQDYGIDASGYNYVSTVDFSCGLVTWGHTANWWHSLSESYMPVPDGYKINQATLQIEGWQVLGFGGELVEVAGTAYWSDLHGWQVLNSSSSIFDLTGTADAYWNSEFLDVSFTPLFEVGAVLARSTLSVDYDRVLIADGGDQTVAAPEPTTILLMGFGLLGGRILSRKRKNS